VSGGGSPVVEGLGSSAAGVESVKSARPLPRVFSIVWVREA
jgi:hypothetical protein